MIQCFFKVLTSSSGLFISFWESSPLPKNMKHFMEKLLKLLVLGY